MKNEIDKKLIQCIYKGDIKGVERCLSQGANANTEDGCSSPLIQASKEGYTQIVELLIKNGADIEHMESEDGITMNALMWASSNGWVDVVECLIKAGANIESKVPSYDLSSYYDIDEEDVGSTPLLIAAEYDRLGVFKCLLNHGANINARTIAGNTVFLKACYHGSLDIMKYLLRDDINRLNEVDYRENTPLIKAVMHMFSSFGTVKWLIEKGADKTLKNLDDKTAYDIVCNKIEPLLVKKTESNLTDSDNRELSKLEQMKELLKP